MELDPVGWLTLKRGSLGLSPGDFQVWATKFGYHEWVHEIRRSGFKATQAYVRWEETVMAAERNGKAIEIAQIYFAAKRAKEQGSVLPSMATVPDSSWVNLSDPATGDISLETAPLDQSIIEAAWIEYVSAYDQTPRPTPEQRMALEARFLERGW